MGYRFTMWPLHITLLPWFSAPDYQELEEKLRESLSDQHAFEAEVGERAYFGYNRNLPVMLIKNNSNLQQLHERILNLVAASSWQLEGRYVGDQYKPHITQQVGKDIDKPKVMISKVTIVEKLGQGYRQVAGEVNLSA